MTSAANVQKPPRHYSTVKAWEWFENDERALTYSDTLRASIKAKLEEIDAELLAWDRVEA